MVRVVYILIFIFCCSLSYGQKKLYKKAEKSLYKNNDVLKAAGYIIEAETDENYKSLAYETETKLIEEANSYIEGNINQAIKYLNNAKAISAKYRKDSLWTPEQTELALNIAYQLKYACEKNSDSSSSCYYRSKRIYESILAQDEYNWAANYNLGAMLYQRAVFKIKQLDYETDIFTVERVQDECIKLFFSALPYLKKAYELNPKEKIIAKSLSELYLSLNDEKKAAEYKKVIKN